MAPFVASLLLRWVTQRGLFIIVVAASVIGLTITILSQSLTVATVGLFINFFGRSVQLGVNLSFMSDNTN